MSENFEELVAKYTEQHAEMRRMQMRVLSKVCKLLQENKIATVIVRYEGSGDEGNTEKPEAFEQVVDIKQWHGLQAGDELTDLLNEMPIPEEWQIDGAEESQYFSKYVDSVGEGLGTLLSDFVPNGYEDNEGGTGCVLLDTATELIEVEHGDYVTEVHWHSRKINNQGEVEIIKEKEETDS